MRPISHGMIEVLRDAMQMGALVAFAIFVTLGIHVARSDGERRRTAINLLIIYTIGVHVFLIAVQKDAWPFSVYPMMARVERDRAVEHVMIAARAVDSAGQEWPVDPSAWAPLYPPSTLAWFDIGYPTASPAERVEVMQFLLGRAENARQNGQDHAFLGNRALLGPLAAPDTNLYWSAPAAPLPFEALRIYRVFWNPSAFAKDATQIRRKLLCEYHS